MIPKKIQTRSPEMAFLLEVVDSGDDGVLYRPEIARSLARPLLLAHLIEKVQGMSMGSPDVDRTRLYATVAGDKAARMIREAEAGK